MTRKMGGFEVHQRTKDSMFNATSLLNQWIKHSGKRKDVNDFLSNKETKAFIEVLEEKSNTGIPVTVSRGGKANNQGTWMEPLLFIDFAMWLNPKFKYDVLKFMYDELIQSRHLAGDNYKAFSKSGAQLKGYDFKQAATALNWIVFNKKGKDLRQSATQEQLKELHTVEEKLSFAIDMGYIKTFEQLMSSMRKLWNEKYNPVLNLN